MTDPGEVDAAGRLGPEPPSEEAYAAQDGAIEASGELVVGAAVRWWTPDEAVFGWLTDAMWLAPEQPLELPASSPGRGGGCSVAPHLVFRLRTELEGVGITATDVVGATAAVAGGLAVLERSPTVSVVDNLGLRRFVVGPVWIEPRAVDLGLVGCLVERDGEASAGGAGAALGGQPARGVAELANHLGRRGQLLPAGSIVAVGNLTDPVPLDAGSSVTASFARLGSITLRAVS